MSKRPTAFVLTAALATAGLQARAEPAPLWHYGAYADTSYNDDLNHPDNHTWRSHGTEYDLGEPAVNMAMVYAHKDAVETSRLGLEINVQAGRDANYFGYSNVAPNLSHSDTWRHFGRLNASYLAPIGRGLTLQAGIFNSIVGEESLYAKDDLNYTRAWIADYSPYLMLGANASYPFTDNTSATLYVINQYFHLEAPNNVPDYGAQVQHKVSTELTLKQAVIAGPDQAAIGTEYWRWFSDTIAEYNKGRLTAWFDHQAGTERVASLGGYRVFWDGAAVAAKWKFTDRVSLAERVGYLWDHDGRLTGSRQLLKEVTTTFEYKVPYKWANVALRLEHRWDESTGPDGGFFYGGGSDGPNPTLRAQQHKIIAALLWTFDSP
jgi:hypothetical protein